VPGPYALDPTLPLGDVESIKLGYSRLQEVRTQIQNVLTDWIDAWPSNAACKAGWPRAIVAANRASFPDPVSPYGRLAYAQDRRHLYRETATGWVNAHPVFREIFPVTGLDGDGFLANPNLCGTQVFDYVPLGALVQKRALAVGRDFRCDINVTYRTFIKWQLAGAPILDIDKVLLTLDLFSKDPDRPPAGSDCLVYRIGDFGTLTFADYNIATIASLGTICTPATTNGPVSLDITSIYTEIVGAGFLAVELRVVNEMQNPSGIRPYAFVSTDEPTLTALRPRLVSSFIP
jgi:hypothetical protein